MDIKKQLASLRIDLAASVHGDGWVMIFPAGRQKGHDGRGPYNLADLETVIAASVRPSVELMIDYDHAVDELPPGHPRIAAGWMKELQARQDGIYARVEWTTKAKQHIADKEYRYISPVFYFDEKTGVVSQILRAALTNNPNLEVKAVAAAQDNNNPSKEIKMDETMKAIAAALGLGEDATPEAILEAVKTLKGDLDQVKEEVAAPADADGAEIIEKIEEKIEAEVASAKKKATASSDNPDPAKFVPIEQVAELQKAVASLQTESTKNKAQAAVDAAVKQGKLPPALKDWGLALASKDMKAFDAYVEKSPTLVTAGAEDDPSKKKAATGAALDDDQKALCAQLGIKEENYAETKKRSA